MNLFSRTVVACSKMGLRESRSNRLIILSCVMCDTLEGSTKTFPRPSKKVSTPRGGVVGKGVDNA